MQVGLFDRTMDIGVAINGVTLGEIVIDKNLTLGRLKIKELLRQLLPRRIHRQRILGGPLRGLYIVTSWHDYPRAILGCAEPKLMEWFQNNVKPGETWLDIGAYHGYTAIGLCHLVGKTGRVFAFEPELITASYLTKTKIANHLDQLLVVPLALGETSQLTLIEGTFLRGMLQNQASPLENNQENQSLFMIAFDQIWNTLCGENETISGVKIDVQGFEISVLRGMLNVLRKHHPKLVVEVHSGVDRDELLKIIELVGYSREAKPIEPTPGEMQAQYQDDRNYEFQKLEQ